MGRVFDVPPVGATAPMIGDHPALDLLNTVAMVEERLVDFLQSDADVVAWLSRQGVAADASQLPPGALLDAARRLRGLIRDGVGARKAGKGLKMAEWNELLRASGGYRALRRVAGGGLELTTLWARGSAEQVLGPVIEQAAALLAGGNFDLVRACEDEQCVLWFYDRTKSHHRRWCSVATCGNRNKVAAFRARQSREKASR